MTSKTDKTDVALVNNDNAPAFLGGYAVPQEDNFDSSDVVIPRIKLLQSQSGEVQTFDNARIGEFWHTGFDMPLGTNFRFVIADRRKKYLLVAPLADGQGILARSDDAVNWDRLGEWQVKIKGVRNPVTWSIDTKDVLKSKVLQWGSSNPENEDSPPAATLFYDYLVFCPDMPDLGPSVISLARSQIRKAKKGINDKIALHRTHGRPMQALIFSASSVEEHGDEGPYRNWSFQSAGFVQDEAFFKQMLEYRGALSSVVVQGEADAADDGKSSGTADDGEGKF